MSGYIENMRANEYTNTYKNLIYSVLICLLSVFNIQETVASDGGETEKFNIGEMINHHIKDSHVWEITHGVVIHLPIILYSAPDGLVVFSSENFFNEGHQEVPYMGYVLEHEHISRQDGVSVLDFSITKNVLFIFIDAFIMLFVFLAVAKGYRKNIGKAPKGIQSLFEPIIIFIRDEVVKPSIGEKYQRYLPYLLTLFFFIWFGNLIGLVPGAANMTGNIAVTCVLAIATFFITNLSGKKTYWSHIFNTPGVPWWLRPIILPVEIIGVLTKPVSLMVRLFVSITAGHIVVLSLISLTFIFHSWMVGFGSTVIVTLITIIELLVATIQAYVFTMFTSLYIGMAVEEHH